ncbi:MAG: hypothetical protein LKJ25_08760 [Clostridia bacterium]|jgi:hypothetical protein|nr:hypothetical protein [Clostridia bacterium]
MELEEQIRLLTGNTNNELISLIISKCKDEISAYTKKEYMTNFDNVCVDMAVIKLNRIGTEGLSTQGYSGVSESYIDGYPAEIMKQLDSFKKKWGAL